METAAPKETIDTVSVGGAAGVTVEAKATVGAVVPAGPDNKVTKVVVAVHGVGDQSQFETIQTVVAQFCRFYRVPPATPLGNFHNELPAFELSPPLPDPRLETLAFAEAYWARIPRSAASEQHTLEKSQKWAATIVERLRLRWRREHGTATGECDAAAEFRLLQEVLSEMVETVTVLERICFIADRAGLFTFDLRKLLDDYLGDVQVVAEFPDSRRLILDTFSAALENAHARYPAAEIYLVAHSEGTVVAWLGLLKAYRSADPPTWTANVRGLMTMGSPLDKHLTLWPELFDGAAPLCSPSNGQKIQWCNYYDRSDPIGFELDGVRDWIAQRGWSSVFDFPLINDIGFTRYPFPGKAHVDYWQDDAVFGHFIGSVVRPQVPPIEGAVEIADPLPPTPKDLQARKIASYVLPYIGLSALLFIAVYLPFKAITGYLALDDSQFGVLRIASDVASVALFLFGVTIAARIPRMTRMRGWTLGSWLIYAAMAALAWWLIERQPDVSAARLGYDAVAWATALSLVVIVASRILSHRAPGWGMKPMLALGTAMLLLIADYLGYAVLTTGGHRDGRLWPVFLAVAGFIYLWWLTALSFDLVFVWHVHIRHSMATKRLRKLLPHSPPQSPPQSSVAPPARPLASSPS